MREEHILVTGFCWQSMMTFLTKNLHILLVKLGSISMGVSTLRAVLLQDKILKYPCEITRLMYGVPLLLHKHSETSTLH